MLLLVTVRLEVEGSPGLLNVVDVEADLPPVHVDVAEVDVGAGHVGGRLLLGESLLWDEARHDELERPLGVEVDVEGQVVLDPGDGGLDGLMGAVVVPVLEGLLLGVAEGRLEDTAAGDHAVLVGIVLVDEPTGADAEELVDPVADVDGLTRRLARLGVELHGALAGVDAQVGQVDGERGLGDLEDGRAHHEEVVQDHSGEGVHDQSGDAVLVEVLDPLPRPDGGHEPVRVDDHEGLVGHHHEDLEEVHRTVLGVSAAHPLQDDHEVVGVGVAGVAGVAAVEEVDDLVGKTLHFQVLGPYGRSVEGEFKLTFF